MTLFPLADSSTLSHEAQLRLDRALVEAVNIIYGFDELTWLSLTNEVFGTGLQNVPSSI